MFREKVREKALELLFSYKNLPIWLNEKTEVNAEVWRVCLTLDPPPIITCDIFKTKDNFSINSQLTTLPLYKLQEIRQTFRQKKRELGMPNFTALPIALAIARAPSVESTASFTPSDAAPSVTGEQAIPHIHTQAQQREAAKVQEDVKKGIIVQKLVFLRAQWLNSTPKFILESYNKLLETNPQCIAAYIERADFCLSTCKKLRTAGQKGALLRIAQEGLLIVISKDPFNEQAAALLEQVEQQLKSLLASGGMASAMMPQFQSTVLTTILSATQPQPEARLEDAESQSKGVSLGELPPV